MARLEENCFFFFFLFFLFFFVFLTTKKKKQKQKQKTKQKKTKKGRDSSVHLRTFRRAVCKFLARRAGFQRGSSGRRWMQGAGGTLGTAVHAHSEATAPFSTTTPLEPPKQGQPLPVHPVPLRPPDVFTFSSLVPPRQGKPLLLLPKHLYDTTVLASSSLVLLRQGQP